MASLEPRSTQRCLERIPGQHACCWRIAIAIGRVFLAGDAAHLNPPWGGHGFNTGIGDAVNIGWKLAAVLDGWGGDGLLASYEVERRPIAERTIREAAANMSVLAPELGNREMEAPGLVGEQARRAAAQVIQATKDREFHSLGLVLGYQYDASPVIVDDGTPSLPEGQDYEPTARPGARLPHIWMPDGASLYDRLGNGLSLLRLRDDVDVTPFIESAATHRVPLDVVELRGQELEGVLRCLAAPRAARPARSLARCVRGSTNGGNGHRPGQRGLSTDRRLWLLQSITFTYCAWIHYLWVNTVYSCYWFDRS